VSSSICLSSYSLWNDFLSFLSDRHNFQTDSMGMATALQVIQQIKDEEFRRIESYRGFISEAHVIEALNFVFTDKFLHFIDDEQTGFLALLQQKRFEELNQMNSFYLSFSSDLGLKRMSIIFREFLTTLGKDILKERKEKWESWKSDPAATSSRREIDFSYLQNLKSFHRKYSEIVATFLSDTESTQGAFQKSIQGAFATFLNNSDLVSNNYEIFSNFCNYLLQDHSPSSSMGMDDLDFVCELATYLSDKDLFLYSYQNQLAHRLLTKKSAGNETERAAISNLKIRFGSTLTSKLEAMLTDFSLSNDLQNLFEEYLKNHEKKDHLDLSIQVLSSSFWPRPTVCNVALPPEMSQSSKVSSKKFQR
jgi:hypothetical protein